jgi:membrane-bound hydrogenase subunit beta
MSPARLSPEEVVDALTREFGTGVAGTRITERREGAKKHPNYNIWIDLDRDLLKPTLQRLIDIHYPHLAVISGTDIGDAIELNYHLSIYYGTRHGEYVVTLTVTLPKDDLRVPTISDLIPGAVFSEMLGIEVVGSPDGRRLFLPDEFPEGIYPWRKDETGVPQSMIKDLWAVGRPENRPARPVLAKDEQGAVQSAEKEEAKVTGRAPSPEEAERHE